MNSLDFKLRILHIAILMLSAKYRLCQVTSWNIRSPNVIFQGVDFFDPGSSELFDEPFIRNEPKLESDFGPPLLPFQPHSVPIPFEPHSAEISHQPQECPIKQEILDPKNIEETRETIQECTDVSVSCYHAHLSKYRTMDGSCNNLQNPTWGKSRICLRRILPHDYADGKSYPRVSCSKNHLPNARYISNVFHQERRVKESKETTQFMEWGQMLAHDLSLNDVFKTPESGFNIPLNCCISGPIINDECISIPIPKNDLLSSKFGVQCLNIIRTVPCPHCVGGPRQHWNQNTAFQDLSLVYGSTEEEASRLRSGVKGMLKIQYTPKSGPLLPPVEIEELCVAQNYSKSCFKAGDTRSNQNIFLLTMHTMFMRYHNFLCQELNKINSHWDDEKLYQEARRIFIAQVQMITYGGYLPIVLGEYMDKFGINVLAGPHYTEYDPTLDPSIGDEYTSVAARYGHTLIPDLFNEISTKTGSKSKQVFADYYYRPFRFYDGQFDKVSKGMLEDKKRKHDVFLASSVRDLLYRRVYLNETAGLDLAAMSLLRGRDHGIPGYTYYLAYLFNITVHNFDDLKHVLPPKSVDLLSEIYESVHDVEIYAAGLAEYYVKGGFVGPTFASILSEQYRRLKFGDRFWFEHGNQAGSFTPDQLLEIKKTSLARIICETTTIKSIQEFVFLPPSPTNPVIPCEKIPRFNLYLWKH